MTEKTKVAIVGGGCAAMAAAWQTVIAGTKGAPGQICCADLERGKREHRFDGRARRVTANHSAIEQRPVKVVLQRVELVFCHAEREYVRVE